MSRVFNKTAEKEVQENKILISKHEILNKSKSQNAKCLKYLDFEHLILFRVSELVFRISYSEC